MYTPYTYKVDQMVEFLRFVELRIKIVFSDELGKLHLINDKNDKFTMVTSTTN